MKHIRFRGKLVTYFIPMFLFLIGAMIFLYPVISNLIAEKNQYDTILNYQGSIAQSRREELDALKEEALVYNENLAGDPVHDPFIVGSGYVLPADYEKVLNINGDGVMAYLEIEKINVHIPIYHGTGEKELEHGAGHLEGTSLPVGGNSRHSILCAHRGLPSAELFTKLDKLSMGDVFLVHVLEETLAYEVDDIKTIKPEELEDLKAIEGKDIITLMTCTPYGVNTHRLLVRGSRIPYEKKIEEQQAIERFDWRDAMITGIGMSSLILLVGFGCYKAWKKKSYEK